MQEQVQDRKMVEAVAVIDLDPSLQSFRPSIEQKWVTSLQFTTEPPKDFNSGFKCLFITKGLYLVIGHCEDGFEPIYQIDILTQPTPEWTAVRMPQSMSHVINGALCYKTDQAELSGPLTDIDILAIERKSRFGESKQVITVPHQYHMLNNPIVQSFLIYRKVRSKLQQNFKPTLLEKYPAQTKRVNLAKLSDFCFPEGIRLSREMTGFITLNFIFTLENGQRIYCTCLIFKEALSEAYKKKLGIKNIDKIFSEKAFCILSQYCYTDEFSECLHHLYRISMSGHDLPFYKVAQNFVDKMVMTNQIGAQGVSYSYGGSNILFKTNQIYPPVSEKAIYTIFKFLTIDNIITVFEAIMLQRTVVFVSQSKTILGYATQAFISLLFPFRWQLTLIPILPSNMKEFLSAPVPLLVGISNHMMDSDIQTESVIVFLDSNEVLNAETLPPLPDKLQKQLLKRLADYEVYDEEEVRDYLDNPYNNYIFQMQEADYGHFQGHIIRDVFFDFMLTLMRNYRKYWKKGSLLENKDTSSMGFNTEPQLMNDMYKTQDFLSDLGMTKVGSFGYKFTQSSIFTCFVERRYQFMNDAEINFFDECIQVKKNKKDSVFIQAVQNSKFVVSMHPEPEKEKTLYRYQSFPSILLPIADLRQEDIMVEIVDNGLEAEQQLLIRMIHEEYAANCSFYQLTREKMEDELQDKMMGLLVRENRRKFPVNQKNRILVVRWFRETYLQQVEEVEEIFQKWPRFVNQITFIPIAKKDYLLKLGTPGNGEVLGVHQAEDYELLMYEEKRIILTQGRTRVQQGKKKSKTHCIEVPSYRLKRLLNSIIPSQPLWLFSFVEEISDYTHWTVETVIDFREWIFRNKNQAV